MEIDYIENKRLVKYIKSGDFYYLNQWIENKKTKLYKIAWSYVYNHEDIEDIFQDTMIKVYENINSLKNINSFETWFISIFINQCRKVLKDRKREIVEENIQEGQYIDEYNFFQEINKIESIYREAIVLKYISGYSQEEIANILDIPLGTVKSRIYRGLKDLRELVKEV